jgi:DNA-binding CsgD family transcriptional regulator
MKAASLSISPDGRYLIIRVPIEYIPDRDPDHGPARVDDVLSRKQLQVFELAVEGKTNKEIGAVLHVVERTIKFHMSQIFTKLNLHGRGDLMRTYRRRPADRYKESVPSSNGQGAALRKLKRRFESGRDLQNL